MNETIGIKGGHNDRKRTLKIEREKKKKLEENAKEKELKELEKKVKKKQIYTLIKVLPIAIAGGTFKTLYNAGKEEIDKDEENSRWKYETDPKENANPERKQKTIVTSTGEKVVIYVDKRYEKPHSIIEDIILHPTIKNDKETKSKEQSNNQIKQQERKKTDEETRKKFEFDNNFKEKNEENETKKYGIGNDNEIGTSTIIQTTSLSKKAENTLLKLKNRKIIDEYEKQLKDVRYELRKLVSEYNMLVEQESEIIVSKEAQIILDKLTEIITRIENLKSKIRIDNLDKYDDNYIYVLVEDYLKEFKDKRIVAEIKDSPLYVLISEKLGELDTKKDELSKKLDDKKEKLEEREIEFDKIKSKYLNIDRINNELLQFQDEQDRLLKEIQEKVKNATTVKEKVEIEFEGMTRQSRRLLRLLTFQMLLPGPKAAKTFATTSAAYLYFMNQIMHPKTKTQKYKVITVNDYSEQIKSSIESIEDAETLLSKTSTQIDKIISEIKTKYKDYLGVIKECDELLHNLEKIKEDLKEKEYEMEKTKEEQRKLLEKNNAKVKTRGQYKM